MFEIDFISALRYVLEQHNVGLRLFDDGMSDFMGKFVNTPVQSAAGTRTLADCIQLKTAVHAIDYAEAKPVLRLADGKVEPFAAVIVAMSTRSADLMGLTMPTRSGEMLLSQRVAQSLRELHMTGASKLFIKTATKWRKNPSNYAQNMIIIYESSLDFLQNTCDFHKHVRCAVHQNVVNAIVSQKRLQRPEPGDLINHFFTQLVQFASCHGNSM